MVSSMMQSSTGEPQRSGDNRGIRRRKQPAIKIAWLAVLFGAIISSPRVARAARVHGVLTGYESSTPLASRDLHFQNNITGDVYLTPTHADGSFRASLPPGNYSLCTETGAILVRSILVEHAVLDLGQVSELAPYAPQRLWQFERIARWIITSPAPSTAYIATGETTPIPSSAQAVPKPIINWAEAPMGPLGGANAATGEATAPLPASHVVPGTTQPRGPAAMSGAPATGMNGAPSGSSAQAPFYSQPEPNP
jgi:hypothetical protein